MKGKRRIGIVIQRYGKEINGGAETLAKMIAEKLLAKYDVTVLTSRAVDYHTWEPVLAAGNSVEGGVKIIRFNHPPKRENTPKLQHRENREARGRLFYQKIYRLLGRPEWYLRLMPGAGGKAISQIRWIELQGPETKDMVSYLAQNAELYSAYIFFTYLYYPTVAGMPAVGSKSIFIPTMHDESAAHDPVFKEVMKAPAAIFFLTEEEKRFSEKTFDIAHIPKRIISVGIDVPDMQPERKVIERFNIKGKYVLYLGRIEPHKGCRELLEYFLAFEKQNPGSLQLVMAGKNDMEAVDDPAVIYAGFVSEREKWQLLKQAQVLMVPSRHESLSLVLLESFACKVPVIATACSEVLKSHIDNSSGGWAYTHYASFSQALAAITVEKLLQEKGQHGYEYVMQNYSWGKVLHAFDETIAYIASINPAPGRGDQISLPPAT